MQSDSGRAQIKSGSLRGHFSAAARQRVDRYLASFVSFKPTLTLLYGDAHGTESGSWSMLAASDDMIAELARMYAGFGATICYEFDGLQIAVPQLAHIDELDAGTLDFKGDRLIAEASDRD